MLRVRHLDWARVITITEEPCQQRSNRIRQAARQAAVPAEQGAGGRPNTLTVGVGRNLMEIDRRSTVESLRFGCNGKGVACPEMAAAL